MKAVLRRQRLKRICEIPPPAISRVMRENRLLQLHGDGGSIGRIFAQPYHFQFVTLNTGGAFECVVQRNAVCPVRRRAFRRREHGRKSLQSRFEQRGCRTEWEAFNIHVRGLVKDRNLTLGKAAQRPQSGTQFI